MASRMHKSPLPSISSRDEASDTYSYHSDTPSLLSDLGSLGDLTLLGDLGFLGDDDLMEDLESRSTPIPQVPLPCLHDPSLGDSPDQEVIPGDLDQSLLTPQDVKCLSGKLEISSDYEFKAPGLGDSYHNPPAGYFTMTLAHFNSGFSIPPHSLLVEVIRTLGISFSQLSPNSLTYFLGFCHRAKEFQIQATTSLFHSIFSIRCLKPEYSVYFQPRAGCKFMVRLRSTRGDWRSHFLFVKDSWWDVPSTWSSSCSVVKMRMIHRHLQVQCQTLGFFDDLFDPKSLLACGLRVNLATLQAREDTMGRPLSTGEKKRVDDRRYPPAPRPSIPTSGLHPQSGCGGGSSSQGRQGPHPMPTDSHAPGVVMDKRKDQCTRGHDDGKRKGEVATPPNFKKGRRDPISSARGPRKNSLFLEGVNAKERVGSFWDTDDPDMGWRKGREMICDHDMAHLVPQPPAALSHSLALIGCQAVSLACAYQAREERGRAEEVRFRRELSQLKEENERLRSENMKFQDDLSCLTKRCEEKTRDDEELRKELGSLYDKHHIEVKTGGMFLASKAGKSFVTGVDEKALAAFRASPAFADEVYSHAFGLHDEVVRDCRRQLRLTGLVPEEVVMRISPHVSELDDPAHVDSLPEFPPVEDADCEVIGALHLLPADGAIEDG
ncbi:uncharacterized protein LOC142528248 [Primulina tabacum]|uniref:uncharacterized protein LOC142528248 n=1 Tax=Primulina tabacum TaxID=48773 RepID=UPI003F5A6B40